MAHVKLTAGQKELLAAIYRDGLLPADQLPYTGEFDAMRTSFLAGTGLTLTHNEVWRALAGIRKAGVLDCKRREKKKPEAADAAAKDMHGLPADEAAGRVQPLPGPAAQPLPVLPER